MGKQALALLTMLAAACAGFHQLAEAIIGSANNWLTSVAGCASPRGGGPACMRRQTTLTCKVSSTSLSTSSLSTTAREVPTQMSGSVGHAHQFPDGPVPVDVLGRFF
jgi:hypothetical protein